VNQTRAREFAGFPVTPRPGLDSGGGGGYFFGMAADELLIYDRGSGKLVRERVLGDALLRLAYCGPARGLGRHLLFRTGLASRLLGWYADTRWSRRKIRPTIAELGIDMRECRSAADSFPTFNAFFCRHLRSGARPFDPDPTVLCSPADARLLAFPEGAAAGIEVKGIRFTVDTLLRDPEAGAAQFSGGSVVILRLCPADYHRFHFPAAGRRRRSWEVEGRFDSVNPIALAAGVNVFAENRRFVSILDLATFGTTAFVAVGAFGVGAVVETHAGPEFGKMDEKGYFKFGGSSIVLLFRPGWATLAADLVQNTRTGYETLVRAGESIGRGPGFGREQVRS